MKVCFDAGENKKVGEEDNEIVEFLPTPELFAQTVPRSVDIGEMAGRAVYLEQGM